ncbi:molybdopterin-dependent oxidoreductase [Phaeobacter sp.]|uniref:molybdopterin-dependent oxidoreductase n=1 Tax=Phaeobacter sp. TaxID=1902409 RepID=UPI0025FBB37C|nr:molybdopterin-dependent oxidoreductase [Phaeobacter sp.]
MVSRIRCFISSLGEARPPTLASTPHLARVFALVGLLASAWAIALPTQAAASEPVVLTLTVPGDTVQQHDFSLDMLQGLPTTEFETTTIWTSGPQRFTGVSLAALLQHIGEEAGQDGLLRARAINDYAVEIPLSDVAAGGPIIAYQRNGAIMSVRDKGPLWVVYPYDSNEGFQTEAIYSRSIWQLEEITVMR